MNQQTNINSTLVLLVDDNPDDRERYMRVLKKIPQADYRYIEAEGYESTMHQVETHQPDCILLDYSLPGRNGLEILLEVIAKYPHIPIIMMTGKGNEVVAVQAIKNGAQHYLVKSDITEESLHTHITAAIRHCKSEKDREDLVQQLVESNIQLKRTQDAITLAVEGISFVNPEGVYIILNQAYASTVGYTPEEMTGKSWASTVHPDDLPVLEDAYRTMLETGKAVAEVRGVKKDGSAFHKRMTIISQYDEYGVFLGHHCFMQDISLQKIQEELKRRLLDRLTESNTQLERFAYIASHDMQEPIRMVKNFSTILLQDYMADLDETGKSYLQMVVDSSTRMQEMVNDLLSYSRLSEEKPKMSACHGDNIFRIVLENLQALIEENNAEVTADTLPDMIGNPVQILRILQNLVANAIKYQPKDNIPKIHVSATEDNEYWRISVSDNGMGIKPEFLEAIFQPFRRLHTWDNIQGTGLGLAICKKIAGSHAGTLSVTSTIGKGSVFTFTIKKPNQQISEAA